MNDMQVTSTQMVWRPQMIKLTTIAYPNMESQPLFIDPALIYAIYKTVATIDGSTEPGIECTIIRFTNAAYNHCIESPERVAMLRDLAYGHKWGPQG